MTKLDSTPRAARHHGLSPALLHDLRTPLNHIIGYAQILAEQADEQSQPGFTPDLRRIDEAAHKMLALLNHDAPPVDEKPADDDAAGEPGGLPDALPFQARILVVDDEKMNRDVLVRRLERQGYGTAVAENGIAAMALLRSEAFDLVLLDVMMPEMDGFEALGGIKNDPALSHIPVIMISALDDVDSVVRCIELGADDYLPKPFDPTLLKARIGSSLQKKRAADREAHLSEQLEHSFLRLQELEGSRDDLTHMIIHDLRVPLTSVISGIQTVASMGGLTPSQLEVIEIATSGGEQLTEMIDGLLDVVKMEAEQMPLDVILMDTAALISSAIGSVKRTAAIKGVALIEQVPVNTPPFEGDETILRRVLANLLGNAIKAAHPGAAVIASVHLRGEAPALVFAISGRYVASDIEFEPRGTSDPLSAADAPSGAGLAFCKLAVEAHGGQIGVDGNPPGTFTFALPLTQPA